MAAVASSADGLKQATETSGLNDSGGRTAWLLALGGPVTDDVAHELGGVEVGAVGEDDDEIATAA